jgi:hypothetical protein
MVPPYNDSKEGKGEHSPDCERLGIWSIDVALDNTVAWSQNSKKI